MYQAFEDYACPTQFPVILKTDEKRLVSSYIVFWVLRDYFPSPCMTTKSRNKFRKKETEVFIIIFFRFGEWGRHKNHILKNTRDSKNTKKHGIV